MNRTQALGRYGEERAANYLHDLGYEIIERNWRSSSGEIDLIAKSDATVVFVEVKTRRGSGYGHPFEAITSDKLSRMRALVQEWRAATGAHSLKVRMDAISVMVSGGRVAIEHIKDLF